jgi:DNA topoisomerase IA
VRAYKDKHQLRPGCDHYLLEEKKEKENKISQARYAQQQLPRKKGKKKKRKKKEAKHHPQIRPVPSKLPAVTSVGNVR